MDELDRHRIEVKPAAAAVLLAEDEPCPFQHVEMVHHGDAADVEVLSQLTDRDARPGIDQVEHAPPVHVGQGVKDRIHVVICKHVITLLHIVCLSRAAFLPQRSTFATFSLDFRIVRGNIDCN